MLPLSEILCAGMKQSGPFGDACQRRPLDPPLDNVLTLTTYQKSNIPNEDESMLVLHKSRDKSYGAIFMRSLAVRMDVACKKQFMSSFLKENALHK